MKNKILVFGLSIAMLFALTGCEAFLWAGRYDVKYVVTGTASTVNLTLKNSSGGTSQYSSKTLPWKYSFSVGPADSDFVYLSAQNNSSSGSVTSEIYVKKSYKENYTLFKTSTSSGSYVIATASGSL